MCFLLGAQPVRGIDFQFPAVMEPVLDAVQGVTDSILALFKAGEINGEGYRKIEQLLRMNHQLLNTMGVGHPALDAVCQTTAEARCAVLGWPGSVRRLPLTMRERLSRAVGSLHAV